MDPTKFLAIATAFAFLSAGPVLAQSKTPPRKSLTETIRAGTVPSLTTAPAAPAITPAVVGPGGGSRGSVTFYSDQAVFEAAHPGLGVEDFEDGNIPFGNAFGCPDPTHAGIDDGFCYDAGDWAPGLWADSNPVFHPTDGIAGIHGIAGYSSQAVLANWNVEAFNLRFPSGDVTAAGFDVVTFFNVREHRITVFDTDDNVVGSTSITPIPATPTFVGVDVTGCNIGRIRIFEIHGVNFEGVDNVQYDGSRFVMAVDPLDPLIGLPMQTVSAGGVPGNLGLNVVTSVDGSPFFYVLLPKFNYPSSGVRVAGGSLPNDPNLIGHRFGFTCFSSRDPGNNGPVIATNEKVVTIQ